jgi:nicotinate-nucleotide pyrophosphorylase (carboxylating)
MAGDLRRGTDWKDQARRPTIVSVAGKSKTERRRTVLTDTNRQAAELSRVWTEAQLVTQFGVSPRRIEKDIDAWLEEDAGGGDVSQWTQTGRSPRMRMEIIAKQDFVVCGLSLMAAVFHRTHGEIPLKLFSSFRDGELVKKGDVVLGGEGDARCLLLGERVSLNLASRLSGIATKSKKMLTLVESAAAQAQCTPPELLETRKTTPGLRLYEKFATRIAGVRNHRHALDTGLMLKENHLRSFGGVSAALKTACAHRPALTKIEIEVTQLDEFREALAGGADVIMLDNFSLDDVRIAVGERARCGRQVALEVSGNLTEENIAAVAKLGVDALSSGALVHQATWVDMSLQLYPIG